MSRCKDDFCFIHFTFKPRAGSRVLRIGPLRYLAVAGCRKKRLNQNLWFLPCNCMNATHGIAVGILSVCLSVRLSATRVVCDKTKDALWTFWYHTKRQSLCYSDTNSGWWATPPSVWNLRSKWSTPFETCRLWKIFAYNVSTVKDSEKFNYDNRKSTTGFPTNYRWSVYVIPKSPKRWIKKRFKKIKVNFNRIKSVTKFLYVKTSSGKVVKSINYEITKKYRTESVSFLHLKYWLKLTYPVVASTCILTRCHNSAAEWRHV